LIDECERASRSEPVHKLASLPRDTINSILIRRGIAAENVEQVTSLLATAGSPLTAEQVVAYSFERHGDRTPPFGVGRFGDGNDYPVYYSAIEEETCISEVRHHTRKSFEAMQSGELPYPRFYQYVSSAFNGLTLTLCGHEGAHPELVSADESGYPFCQSLARQALAQGISAFHAPSARHDGGVCVPVFMQQALSNHRSGHFVMFAARNGQIEHEKVGG
jgi:RES domain